jgi:hypothetical protein
MAAKKLPARDQPPPTESLAAKPRAQGANEDNQPGRRGAVITIATAYGAALRTPQYALQCNSQRLIQAFSINETSKLLSRHLAHFVAAIDQIDLTRKLRLPEHQRICCSIKPRRYFQVDRMVKSQ